MVLISHALESRAGLEALEKRCLAVSHEIAKAKPVRASPARWFYTLNP